MSCTCSRNSRTYRKHFSSTSIRVEYRKPSGLSQRDNGINNSNWFHKNWKIRNSNQMSQGKHIFGKLSEQIQHGQLLVNRYMSRRIRYTMDNTSSISFHCVR